MKYLTDNFKNASFMVCGATSFLLLAQYVLCEVGIPDVLPATGIGYVTGLCWHVLFFWAGLLLRQLLPNPRWWIQLPVLAVVAFLISQYLHYSAAYWTISCLYIAIFGLGYIFPPKMLERIGSESGWVDFVLLLASVFCSVAVSVSSNRINRGIVFGDQYQDMERLLEWLLSYAEPLMVLLVVYFATRVSFSKEGLWLGGRTWFQSAVAVIAAALFFFSLGNVIPIRLYRWVGLLRFLVQPIPVYLLIVLVRAALKLTCQKKWGETTWREIFNI